LSQDGYPVNGAEVCVFNGPSAGFLDNTCEGSSFPLTTDVNGKARTTTIGPGTYYVLVKVVRNGIPYLTRDTVVVDTDDVSRTVRLQQPNGISFTTSDGNLEKLPGVKICIFTSRMLFEQGLCDGSNYQLISDVQGGVSLYNIPASTYYILATLTVGEEKWVARNTIQVDDNIEESILVLKKE